MNTHAKNAPYVETALPLPRLSVAQQRHSRRTRSNARDTGAARLRSFGRSTTTTTTTTAATVARDNAVKQRCTGAQKQRILNRPRGMSCSGNPAHLRPTSSCRDHSSHFHVPKSQSQRPSSLDERRNVRISASPDVDSAATICRCGRREQSNVFHRRCNRPANPARPAPPASSSYFPP